MQYDYLSKSFLSYKGREKIYRKYVCIKKLQKGKINNFPG